MMIMITIVVVIRMSMTMTTLQTMTLITVIPAILKSNDHASYIGLSFTGIEVATEYYTIISCVLVSVSYGEGKSERERINVK